MAGSMPNFLTSVSLVERAIKCLAMCFSSRASSRNHFRAEWALVKVSWVVKVLEATKNKVVAGKEAKEFVEFVLKPEVLGEAKLGYEKLHNPAMYAPHFGIDESGKGDLFGPLVVAGVYVDEGKAERLIAAGVRDSKTTTSDKKIGELAEEIGKAVGPGREVVTIGPEKYSELYKKFGNLNRLLAWAHGKVIANLHGKIPECPRALSDQCVTLS